MPQVLDFVVIDAMTGEAFKGNPTPVLIFEHLEQWPSKRLLQTIAREMNHSETIFVKRAPKGLGVSYEIRSFTPYAEEPFCGHGVVGATIALRQRYPRTSMSFRTVDGIVVKAELSGPAQALSSINVLGQRVDVRLILPSVPITESLNHDTGLREGISNALGIRPSQVVSLGRNSLKDLVIELHPEVDYSASAMKIDAVNLMEVSPPDTRSQVITSTGEREGADFVKRVFAYGSEDQATGSTHCLLAPYWGSKLGKSCMTVKQVSERTGQAEVENVTTGEGWVALNASGILVMEGKILIPGGGHLTAKL